MGLISIEDCKHERNGRNTVLKRRSVAKLIKTNENLNLCYIWRLPPPPKQINKKHITHFWLLHSKRTRLFFCFKHTSKFCKKTKPTTTISFFIFLHWPFTNFFSHLNKDIVMFEEDDYRSLIGFFLCQIVSILKVWKNTFVKFYIY